MGVYNETFGSKQVPVNFNLSMMTQVDELEQDRHLCMSFCEFVEAIVRVAEKLEISNLTVDLMYDLSDIRENSLLPEDRAVYAARSLPEKIEAMLVLIAAVHVGPKGIKAHEKAVEKYKVAGVYANDIETGIIKF